jgi:hypothetical protein
MAKREMGTTFILLVHFQCFPGFRLVAKRFISTIKAPFPLLPLTGFGSVSLESEGNWEGDFSEAIFVHASSNRECFRQPAF